ncbi:MAG: dihydroorotate dehydrogenase [Patescibacteria group bacterium]|nr:dihydroorotate dehydrogenase [Patescibacteria group bacterium]MDD4610591.1 dihydroorotate dehydrogenase [Patescibacteria group bacterium]
MFHQFLTRELYSCEEVRPGIIRLAFFCSQDSMPAPGQFFVIKPFSGVMRRPFSVAELGEGIVSLYIRVVGKNTLAYSRLKKGDKIEMAGPKGRPIVLAPELENLILVAGGIGFAPFLFLLKEAVRQGKKVTILLGAKNKSQLFSAPFKGWGAAVETITDADGFVTDLLAGYLKSDAGKSAVIACGPVAMLAKTAEMCAARSNPCQVIMEEMMACGGTGACKSCAVFGKDGSVKYVCQDGPAFPAKWVDWPRLEQRFKVISLPESSPHRANPLAIVLRGQHGRQLVLRSPLLPASGCFDIGHEGPTAEIASAGALISKGIKPQVTSGNQTPRVCEVNGGMLNSIGLAGPGIDAFIAEHLPFWLATGLPVFVNIAGATIEDYEVNADKLAGTGIAGVEVNVSCPNLKKGGMAFGTLPIAIYEITSRVRQKLPHAFIIVKHTPRAMGNIVMAARAARDGGADANSLINTIPARAIDIRTRKPKLGAGSGGFSGPAILPIAVQLVYELAKANLGIPIIGCGGVNDPDGATQLILAGASAVAIGAGLFAQPDLLTKIARFWKEEYLPSQGVYSIQDLVGKGE